MPRIPEPAELADDIVELKRTQAADIAEIKRSISDLSEKLDQRYVPRELYEARHIALRNEIALEFAAVKAENATTSNTAGSARALSLWCLGIFGAAVLAAFIGFIATGGTA